MARQALYRTWRPTGFDEVAGQAHVIDTIRNAIVTNRLAHAYLFSGPRGTGKTTTARLLAKALNCLDSEPANRPCNVCDRCIAVNEGRYLDLIEIDAASNNSVDDVRDLRERINFSPGEGEYKVYIIDEVHMLSKAAFNALLKTLEEPPPHAVFVLATTELERVPVTVKSRCQQHTFRRIPSSDIVARLETIVASEGIDIPADVLAVVARQATGSLRDAISLLDQLVVEAGTAVTMAHAQSVLGTASYDAVYHLVDALAAGDTAAGLAAINTAADSGTDSRQFARQVVDYLRGVMLLQLGSGDALDVDGASRERMTAHSQQLHGSFVVQAVRHFNDAANNAQGTWLAQLPLELALVESIAPASVSADAAPVVQAPAAVRPAAAPATARPAPTPTAPSAPAAATPAAAETGANTSAPTPASTINVAELNKQWATIQERSRGFHGTLKPLMDWCRPVDARGNTVVLGFEKEIFIEKMSAPDIKPKMEALLSEFVGQAVHIHCVKGNVQHDANLPDIEDDGVVAMGVKLGGRPRPKE